jgi:predicted NBD/HSP70 family sugar kinase
MVVRSRNPTTWDAAGSGSISREPSNRPVKLVNDAAMQALGSYKGGKRLFLGLGTGLGSAMIVEGIVAPVEIAHLPYKQGTYEDYVGRTGLERDGEKKW